MENPAPYFSIRQSQLFPREETLETGRRERSLVIGIPAEKSKSENRVGLTPLGVELLVQNGHKVIIELGAGVPSNYFDKDYSECGAVISSTKQGVYEADIILKISPPTLEEISLMRPNQLLLSFLFSPQLDRELITALMEQKINAVAYDFLGDDNGCYPVIRSMSEIEGYTAITIASEYLSKAHGGKGVLLGGITGVSPAEVVIIGAGTAGEFATRAALGLGCTVKVFDNSYKKLRELERNIGQRLFTSILHPQVLTKALKSADAVVASLSHLDADHGFYITHDQGSHMKPGSIIIDLSMGNNRGCFEYLVVSGLEAHEQPVVNERGIIHYSMSNVATRVPRTASIALSNIFTPLISNLARAGGVQQLIKEDPGFRGGTYIYKGILTNSHIGEHFNVPFKDIGLLMAAF